MRIHYLQHVAAEGPAYIEEWALRRGHSIGGTMLYAGEALPDPAGVDGLVILGGPMNVYEEAEHSWLGAEKRFIRDAIDAGRHVFGVCLGAQLIADALGAAIEKNKCAEIGWFPLSLAENHRLTGGLGASAPAFHWHMDRFSLPDGATWLGGSKACDAQIFAYGDRVLAMQCHLEETEESVEHLLQHFAHEMAPGPFVQSVDEIRAGYGCIAEMNGVLGVILDRFFAAEGTKIEA